MLLLQSPHPSANRPCFLDLLRSLAPHPSALMSDLPPGHARVSSLVSGMAGINTQQQQQQQQQQQTSSTAASSNIPSQLSPKPSGLAQYQKLAAIGEGTFGKVHKIVRLSDGEVLVWKELYYGGMNTKEKEQLVSEVNILRELNHKHVVKYFDRIIDREAKKIYIVMVRGEQTQGGEQNARAII